MHDDLRSVVLGTAGLSIAAVAAIVLTVTRAQISAKRALLLRRLVVVTRPD